MFSHAEGRHTSTGTMTAPILWASTARRTARIHGFWLSGIADTDKSIAVKILESGNAYIANACTATTRLCRVL
jgi:hypothetical protein